MCPSQAAAEVARKTPVINSRDPVTSAVSKTGTRICLAVAGVRLQVPAISEDDTAVLESSAAFQIQLKVEETQTPHSQIEVMLKILAAQATPPKISRARTTRAVRQELVKVHSSKINTKLIKVRETTTINSTDFLSQTF